ncbi:MAG TPA: endo-1,4-beta-xylanase [Steroidobacteraceae bacterium]|jgi:endo-1,4-beta-xylanase|nr:endo-1,4-beta-xylanase [Steroidobacteraceae bacterium]
MLHRARSWSFLAASVASAFMWALPAGAQTLPQQIAQYTFADGTADGWTAFFDASAPAYSAAATEDPGTGSLLTTVNYTSSGGGGGPALQLTGLIPGATYTITGYVMLTSGEAASDTNFTVQRQDPGCSGGTCYDTIGTYQVPVTATGWAQIGGTYTVSTSETSLLLYAQLDPGTTPTTPQSFYLDDVTITETAGPPNSGQQDNSGITTNFEDGGLDGWSQRSGASGLSNVAIANGPQGDTNGLLVQDRAAYWDGPQISVLNKMYVGSQYSISVWVMSPTGDSMNLSLQTTLTSSGTANTSYTTIATVTAPAGQWVQISLPRFSMSEPYDPTPGSAYVYVQSSSNDTGTNGTPSPTAPFYISDFQLTYLPPLTIQQTIPSIYQTLAAYFPVGAEIDSSDLTGPHEQLLVKHFDSIVSGNDMKWQETEPAEGQFTFTVADQEVALAQANKMLVRGHNLVWSTGAQVPSWVFLEADGTTPLSASNPQDVQLLTERIQNHIRNVVQHFGTAVYVWDVVNEPLDPTQSDCLEHGPFYQVLGRKYIDIALQAARDYAPPGTQLFFNDYSTTDSNRLQCMIRLVRYLRNHHVPLDGVGHEMHNHIDNPSPYSMYYAIDRIHKLFPHLHEQVTELDMSVYPASDNTSDYGANGGSVPDSIIAEQGWLYKDYFDEFRALKGKLNAVTFWGMADDDTWLDSFPIDRLDEPLPFDQLLQAKPAYWGIVDPTQLPGYGMTLALSAESGGSQSQSWTITATNPSEATAYNTEINGAFLFQVRGWPCRATLTPPSKYPVLLGNVGGGGTASASFGAQFQHCRNDARFVLWAPWSANVYQMGTLVQKNLQP